MSAIRVRCQVVEVPAIDDLEPREEGTWPRDLLPWADPYIASLMMQLGRSRGETEGLLDDELTLSQFAADQWHDDSWKAPLSVPADRTAAFRDPPFPPLYGGFPLLEDR